MKSDAERRDGMIMLRLNEAERKILKAVADKAGKNFSETLRDLAAKEHGKIVRAEAARGKR